ncbi:hypothetical protein NC969_08230 [Leptolyngbya subtilissima ST-M1]|uniref:hypothetical protein n=1 Tax=Leptolyngbya subtilissima TaxID=1346803 RepID=UPI001F54E124
MEFLRCVHGGDAGVSTFLYFPFAVFNIASPILSLLYGITGFKIDKLPTAPGPAAEAL